MACGAQRDQVRFEIVTTLTAKLFVVHLEVRSAPATLASPTITPQHLLSELFVQPGIKSLSWLFG